MNDNEIQAIRKKGLETDEDKQERIRLNFSWDKGTRIVRIVRLFYVVLIIISIGCAIGAFIQPKPTISSSKKATLKSRAENVVVKSPVCDITFNGLTMDQMAALSYAAYFLKRSEDYNRLLNTFFSPNWSLVLNESDVDFEIDSYEGFARHYTKRIEGKDNAMTHFIVIKGSAYMMDFLADIEIWATSAIMNILKMLIPTFSLHLSDTRDILGREMHGPQYAFRNFSFIYDFGKSIIKLVNSINISDGSEIIILGHSLGGGLSKIVSAATGFKAVSISGPGITALSQFVKWQDNTTANTFINVVPSGDIVAGVDLASGTNFYIPCSAKNILNCHEILRTACMLATMCGRYDDYYDFCLEQFDNSTEQMDDLWKVGHPVNISTNS